uniref:Uncharacterized protein n=1 Tax=Arundo donax TaxID=35708 RepID=A0A0A9BHM7_ARUDO
MKKTLVGPTSISPVYNHVPLAENE